MHGSNRILSCLCGAILVLVILMALWLNVNPCTATYILTGIIVAVIISAASVLVHRIKKEENLKSSVNNKEKSKYSYKYCRQKTMTDIEKRFYNTLNEIVGSDFIVQPQVNLASVIGKENGDRYTKEIYQNVDFGIFKRENYELQMLIELNADNNHTDKRRHTEQRVREICNEANVSLISFWLNMPNTKEYVMMRIRPFIKNDNNILKKH